MNAGLVLLVREHCELCEQMQLDLAALASQVELPALQTLEVDSDPTWLRRYGLKVPVLLWDGQPISETRLDPVEIQRLFRPR